jgi:hypothetical protein
MNKVQRDQEDLKDQLRKQYKFLCHSLENALNGDSDEIYRLATTIRILIHNTRNSTSLLQQINPEIQLIDTSRPVITPNTTSHPPSKFYSGGLVRLSLPRGWVLSPASTPLYTNIQSWWERNLFIENNTVFTRKLITLWIADTDGGAHVDPLLDQKYYQISRKGSTVLQFYANGNQYHPNGPEKLIIPYISLELAHSLHAAFPEICFNHKLPTLQSFYSD